jgi:hypothetical protein
LSASLPRQKSPQPRHQSRRIPQRFRHATRAPRPSRFRLCLTACDLLSTLTPTRLTTPGEALTLEVRGKGTFPRKKPRIPTSRNRRPDLKSGASRRRSGSRAGSVGIYRKGLRTMRTTHLSLAKTRSSRLGRAFYRRLGHALQSAALALPAALLLLASSLAFAGAMGAEMMLMTHDDRIDQRDHGMNALGKVTCAGDGTSVENCTLLFTVTENGRTYAIENPQNTRKLMQAMNGRLGAEVSLRGTRLGNEVTVSALEPTPSGNTENPENSGKTAEGENEAPKETGRRILSTPPGPRAG